MGQIEICVKNRLVGKHSRFLALEIFLNFQLTALIMTWPYESYVFMTGQMTLVIRWLVCVVLSFLLGMTSEHELLKVVMSHYIESKPNNET